MTDSFYKKLYQSHQECPKCPSPVVISQFFVDLMQTLFPDFSKKTFSSQKELELHLNKLKIELDEMLTRNPMHGEVDLEDVAESFFNELPAIHERILDDITAMYQGDPAAKSRSEVIRTYPGFYAIAAYRVAHVLHSHGVKVIPRIITEHAHSKTGIDIHPGAQIGEHFCIDHGTGVVIGETTIIGNNVKVYQGVTLGALSVDKKDAETKRHPTIEDNVVIYAGATILGGNTTIGANSVVGGNVWLTRSIPANTKIYYQAKMHNSDTEQTDIYVYKEN
ncbi:MAG: serine acetyltransferase [bacterium]|nr:serine acetyltransferase [bacterium]